MVDVVNVSFPGGKKVAAEVDGHKVLTDQPVASGGENAGPPPLMLFLMSLAACAGAYALAFCEARGISTDGMSLTMKCEWSPEEHRYTRVVIELETPPDFPEKYRKAIARAMEQCTVKRCILNPPEFETVVK